MGAELQALREMEFPGRVILIGKSPNGLPFVLYGLARREATGRNRRLQIAGDRINVISSKDGSVLYAAIICGDGIAVGNGEHTTRIHDWLGRASNPVAVLEKALRNVFYTFSKGTGQASWIPKISGCVRGPNAALSIAYVEADGNPKQAYHPIGLEPGRGAFITTYAVSGKTHAVVFKEPPRDVSVPWATLEAATEALYQALGPVAGGPDYRVGVAGVLTNESGDFEMQVRNREDSVAA